METPSIWNRKIPDWVVATVALAIIVMAIWICKSPGERQFRYTYGAEIASTFSSRLAQGDRHSLSGLIALLHCKKPPMYTMSTALKFVPELGSVDGGTIGRRKWLEEHFNELVFDPQNKIFVTREFLEILREVASRPSTSLQSP